MSNRKSRAAQNRVMPSLYEIGRQIVALEATHDTLDTRQLDKGISSDERFALDKAKSRIWDQTEALVDLGLAMVPETAADVCAQLVMVDRRLDWLIACEMPVEEMKAIAADALHTIRASLPVVAAAGRVDLDEVLGYGARDFIDRERDEVGGAP